MTARRIAFLVLLLGLFSFAAACSSSGSAGSDEPTSTEAPVDVSSGTSSSEFATFAERRNFLEEYVALPTPITDTSFHIFYLDNSGGRVPGPSDWDMELAVRVEPEDIDAWTEGYTSVDELDLTWSEPLVATWMLESEPVFFERSGSMVAVYEPEGVVLKRIFTT